MQTILITGGAGFIGSNFTPFFLEANANYKVVNLDLLTYAGDLQNLKGVEENFRYTFVKGDILQSKFRRKAISRIQYSRSHSFCCRIARGQLDKNPGCLCENKRFWNVQCFGCRKKLNDL